MLSADSHKSASFNYSSLSPLPPRFPVRPLFESPFNRSPEPVGMSIQEILDSMSLYSNSLIPYLALVKSITSLRDIIPISPSSPPPCPPSISAPSTPDSIPEYPDLSQSILEVQLRLEDMIGWETRGNQLETTLSVWQMRDMESDDYLARSTESGEESELEGVMTVQNEEESRDEQPTQEIILTPSVRNYMENLRVGAASTSEGTVDGEMAEMERQKKEYEEFMKKRSGKKTDLLDEFIVKSMKRDEKEKERRERKLLRLKKTDKATKEGDTVPSTNSPSTPAE